MRLYNKEETGAAVAHRKSLRNTRLEARSQHAARLAVGLYSTALRALPAAVRVWFGDLKERNVARALAAATAAAVSPALLAAEFDAVERFSSGTFGGGGGDDAAGELTIKAGTKLNIKTSSLRLTQCP